MYQIQLGKSGLRVPAVAVGCMRINQLSEKELAAFIDTAMENGANFFDHADIYGKYTCEARFGKAITPQLREKIILQTKCGIVPGKMYDYSYGHIVASVENSLKNFGTDYIDVLLLHRPDTLVEPEEVASAFAKLKEAGKVNAFGVSNFSASQMELFRAYGIEIAANQMQFSLGHTAPVDAGFNVNMYKSESVTRAGDSMEYCRVHNIPMQAWSPLQYGFFEGVFVGNEKFPELNAELNRLAEKYGVTPTAIAFAWILRHPAFKQAVTGTTSPQRMKEICMAGDIVLTREEWYSLYLSTGRILP